MIPINFIFGNKLIGSTTTINIQQNIKRVKDQRYSISNKLQLTLRSECLHLVIQPHQGVTMEAAPAADESPSAGWNH